MADTITLQTLVNQAQTLRPSSVYDLADHAQAHGHKINGSTLQRIQAGTYASEPSVQTLRAVAWLAQVPESVAFTAVGLRTPEAALADPQSLRDLLTRAQDLRQVSLRQQAFLAADNGHPVSYTTLTIIRSGEYTAIPGSATLRAIAWLAQVPEAKAFDLAGRPPRSAAPEEPLTLDALVEKALEVRQTSARGLAALAHENGHRITASTLNLIRTRRYKSTPRPETLRTLAWLAEVPVETVFAAADYKTPSSPLADELPPGSDDLSPRARKAVIELIRVLIASERDAAAA